MTFKHGNYDSASHSWSIWTKTHCTRVVSMYLKNRRLLQKWPVHSAVSHRHVWHMSQILIIINFSFDFTVLPAYQLSLFSISKVIILGQPWVMTILWIVVNRGLADQCSYQDVTPSFISTHRYMLIVVWKESKKLPLFSKYKWYSCHLAS